MSKFLLSFFLLLSYPIICSAQSYNAFRFSGGVSISSNLESGDNYALKVGPAISISYARGFNNYLSVEAEVYSAFVNNTTTARSTFFDFSVNGFVTPLAKVFKYLELGVGLAVRYDGLARALHEDGNGDAVIGFQCTQNMLMGINYILRIYAIRNSRFDLFAFYEPRTNFTKDFSKYYWRSSSAGVAFGVKF